MPLPDFVTVRVVAMPNVALTTRSTLMITVQTRPALFVHPVHESKTWPDPAVAVSVTVVSLAYDSEQSSGQAMPAGLEATEPLPAVVAVSV